MTPNKLPPLPDHVGDAINELAAWANSDGDEVSAGTKRAEDALRQRILGYGQKCHAEALRQSQSLPAGAVPRSESSKLIASGVVSPEYVGSAMAYLDSLRAKKETPSDEELPGMWSQQDFTSSQPDEVRGPRNEDPRHGLYRVLEHRRNKLSPIDISRLEHAIKALEALQADAREKGKAVAWECKMVGRDVGWHACTKEQFENIRLTGFYNGPGGARCEARELFATQPAQASEKDSSSAFRDELDEIRESEAVADKRETIRKLNYALWMDGQGGCEPPAEWQEGYRLGLAATHPQPVTPAGGEVEPENGPLPRPLWDHEKEWYTLCERAPHADSIKISGQLAEAIIEAVCRAPIKTTPAELNAEYARGRADGWEAHPPVADAALDVDALIERMDKLADYAGILHHDCPVVMLATVRHVLVAALNQRGGGDHG